MRFYVCNTFNVLWFLESVCTRLTHSKQCRDVCKVSVRKTHKYITIISNVWATLRWKTAGIWGKLNFISWRKTATFQCEGLSVCPAHLQLWRWFNSSFLVVVVFPGSVSGCKLKIVCLFGKGLTLRKGYEAVRGAFLWMLAKFLFLTCELQQEQNVLQNFILE